MAKLTEHTIGIDISKTHLDAFRLEDQAARRFENAPRGFRALIRSLGQTPVARIVFEPTGPLNRLDQDGYSISADLRQASSCGSSPQFTKQAVDRGRAYRQNFVAYVDIELQMSVAFSAGRRMGIRHCGSRSIAAGKIMRSRQGC